MKIFILCEGGNNIGYGHVTRSMSIGQAFTYFGFNSTYVINQNEIIKEFLVNNHVINLDWANHPDQLKPILKAADVVVIDSFRADFKIYELISKHVKVPVYLDDFVRFDYPKKGVVLNGTIGAEQFNYSRKDNLTYLLGVKYQPLRKEFWNVPPKKIKEKVEKILIVIGANDVRNLLRKIVTSLEINDKNIQISIITTKKMDSKNFQFKNQNIHIFRNLSANEMKSLMLSADLAISAGGQTLYELARVGVPSVAISVAENQRFHLSGWKKVGFVKYAGSWKNKNTYKNIKKIYYELLNRKERLAKYRIAKNIIDGKGAVRVSEYILNKMI